VTASDELFTWLLEKQPDRSSFLIGADLETWLVAAG
jgi:hypothetical protein